MNDKTSILVASQATASVAWASDANAGQSTQSQLPNAPHFRCPLPCSGALRPPFARPPPKFYWSAGEEHGNLILIIIGGTHHATQITNDSGRAVIWHIASSGSEAHLSFSSGGDL
jgi:hypothetical protein